MHNSTLLKFEDITIELIILRDNPSCLRSKGFEQECTHHQSSFEQGRSSNLLHCFGWVPELKNMGFEQGRSNHHSLFGQDHSSDLLDFGWISQFQNRGFERGCTHRHSLFGQDRNSSLTGWVAQGIRLEKDWGWLQKERKG